MRTIHALAWLLLAKSVLAQAPVGFTTVAFPNPTGVGSSALTSIVVYPAVAPGGQDAAVAPSVGGHPSIVFLHGVAAFGSAYFDLATIWATVGYVVVLNDTAWLDPDLQRDDGAALHAAIVQANQTQGDALEGAFDVQRIGLAGHSMGGGNTVRILASNPGYRAGFAFACFDGGGWASTFAPQVTTPIGFVHGMGDAVVPWTASQAFATAASSYSRAKVEVVFGSAGMHFNLANLTPIATPTDAEVFARSVQIATGFFDAYLRDDPRGLEAVAGPGATGDPHVVLHDVAVREPGLWTDASLALGTSPTLRLLSAPGYAVLWVSPATASIATPFGELSIEPAFAVTALDGVHAGRLDVPLSVPNDGNLAGFTTHLQALALTADAAFRLSNGLAVTIVP